MAVQNIAKFRAVRVDTDGNDVPSNLTAGSTYNDFGKIGIILEDASGNPVNFLASTPVALTPGTTVALNANRGNIFTLTPAQNFTLNITGGSNGQPVEIYITQDGTGSRTLTLGTGGFLTASGLSLTLTTTANRTDVLYLRKVGSSWYIYDIKKNFA